MFMNVDYCKLEYIVEEYKHKVTDDSQLSEKQKHGCDSICSNYVNEE